MKELYNQMNQVSLKHFYYYQEVQFKIFCHQNDTIFIYTFVLR